MTKVKVRWYAADGYLCNDRPKTAVIDASDFEGLDRADAEDLFNELMQDIFLEKVAWDCDDYEASLDEIMAAAKAGETDG
jgi:hypothetical protein